MRQATLLLLLSGVLSAQSASIEGTAVNAVTAEPLAGVHVRLIAADFQGANRVYGAMSGSGGAFSIDGVTPGTYLVVAERAGYVQMLDAATAAVPYATVILKSNQRLAGHRLAMTPRAVLRGRVVDDFGDPVPNVEVEATPASKTDAAPTRFGTITYRTDDRGEFRISGGPGKFRLKATPRSGATPETRTDGSPDGPFETTWYPAAPDEGRATIVEVAGGAERGGLEIRLSRQRNITISGVATGAAGPGRAVVRLQTMGADGRPTGLRDSVAEADGTFAFVGVRPGRYRIAATFDPGRYVSAPVDFAVESSSPPSFTLALAAPAELTGRLEMEGSERPAVILRPLGYSYLPSASATAGRDGGFRLTGVSPGKYEVAVDPLPENAFVRAIALDGVPAARREIDVSLASTRLSVTVSRNGARLSGCVTEADGKKLEHALGVVALVDAALELRRANVDGEGRYSFQGLPPGKYRALAVDAYRTRIGGMDELAAATAKLEEFELKEGETVARDLKVAPKEDSDAKPQR